MTTKKPLKEWKNSYARNNIEAYRKYQREYRRKRRATDPEFQLRCARHAATYHGTEMSTPPDNMSEKEFTAMLEVPACQICLAKFEITSEKHMDHDHTTGKIRGILCRSCNIGLGYFLDNIDLLENAKIYLKNNTE